MAEHGVVLFGCDADTAVIIDLDEYEAQTLLRVQEKVNEAGFGCKPVMSVFPIDEEIEARFVVFKQREIVQGDAQGWGDEARAATLTDLLPFLVERPKCDDGEGEE